MTRPNLFVGTLAAVCVGTLLWCAWLILAADLPRGAHIASWFLWLVSTAAAVTLLAYLREFLAHRDAVGSDAGWKPLPGLVLLWIGGLTALVSFAFILPDPAPSGSPARQDKAGTALTSSTLTPTAVSGPASTTPSTTATSAAGPVTSRAVSTSASRSVPARTTPPSSQSSAARGSSTSSATSGTTTPSGTTSSTTSPLIDLHILPTLPGG